MLRRNSLLASLLLLLAACDKEAPKAAADAGSGPAAPSSAPVASAAESASATASAAPAASALPPRTDCPKGSAGPGTFDHPCEGKGAVRLMTAEATGKSDDKGSPQFRIVNKHSAVILYGKVVVYFYDRAGKQLEPKDASGSSRKNLGCGGNIFGGVMKAGEKAVVSFSCLKKDQIPEGAASIEAEIAMVGFADSSEKKSEFYWKNDELAPDARKKGGVK